MAISKGYVTCRNKVLQRLDRTLFLAMKSAGEQRDRSCLETPATGLSTGPGSMPDDLARG